MCAAIRRPGYKQTPPMETMVSALLSLVENNITFLDGWLYSAVPRYFPCYVVPKGQLSFQIHWEFCPHNWTSRFLLEVCMAMDSQVSIRSALVLALYAKVYFVALFRSQGPIPDWSTAAESCSGYHTIPARSLFYYAFQILHAIATCVVTLYRNSPCAFFLGLQWI